MKTSTPIILLCIGICFSCQSKKGTIDEKTRTWEGKPVTQQEYDSLLYGYTLKFVETYVSRDSTGNKWDK